MITKHESRQSSPLELRARLIAMKASRIGSTQFCASMLAEALRVAARPESTDPQFRGRFLNALADALIGKDSTWDINIKKKEKSGPQGNAAWAYVTDEEFHAYEFIYGLVNGDFHENIIKYLETIDDIYFLSDLYDSIQGGYSEKYLKNYFKIPGHIKIPADVVSYLRLYRPGGIMRTAAIAGYQAWRESRGKARLSQSTVEAWLKKALEARQKLRGEAERYRSQARNDSSD